MSSSSAAAARSASRRVSIGADPAWLSAPAHRAVVPARALGAGDDADPQPLGLEDRPLLDVQLEQRADLAAADRALAGVADPLELRADRPAGRVLARQGVIELERAGEHA